MARPVPLHDLQALPQAPATDIQKKGWRQFRKLLGESGRVVVTNHRDPEAVVLSLDEYARLQAFEHECAELKAGQAAESPVDVLTRRFKQRMAERDEAAMAGALRGALERPTRPAGRLKVDDRY